MSDENKTPDPIEEEKDDELEIDDSDLDELDLGDEEEETDEDEEEEEEPIDGDGDKEPSKEKDRTAALNIQRKKFRDRALKAEAELAKLKKKQSKPASKETDLSSKEERIDFRFDHPELSSKEVDEIEAIAKAKGVSLEQAMKSPVIKVFLKASARKREHSKASPETRHRAAPRLKGKDPSEMSPEEFEAMKRQVKSGQFRA